MTALARLPAEISLAALPAAAESLTIDSAESYQYAADLDLVCGERIAAVKRELDPSREAAHALWKGLVAKIADFCRPAETARTVIRRKMGDYEERARERKRQADAAAKAERERQKREAAEQLAAALAAEEAGDAERAAATLEIAAAAEAAPAPIAAPVAVPMARGVAMRSYWSAQVVDLEAFLLWVGGVLAGAPRPAGTYQGDVLGLVGANMPRLNDLARQGQSEDLGIPGIRGVERREPARTGR